MSGQAQSMFDKGLHGSLPEQLATVSKLSRLFEENPSPTFVNAMLLRVADAFKDGNLDLRIAIVRALSQCGSHLTLAFSSSEIFRRILTVSHSNDPKARENVLDVLAVLAPLLPGSNQAHHFIRESLSTEHEGEFRAACHALKSFASLSQPFAESIVLQIGKILEEDDASEARKVQLCAAFSTMSATAQVVELVFGIAETVLRRTTADEYFLAFLESTTSLCIEIRYAIPKQIDLLLNFLHPPEREKRKPSKTRELIILRELRRLSTFSNIWTEKQVKVFASTLNSSLTERSMSEFFDSAISLTKNSPRGNLSILKKLVFTNTGYGSRANPEVSVRFVQLAARVCMTKQFESDMAELDEAAMTSLAVVIVNTCTCGKLKTQLANRLYRAVGDILLTFPYSQHSFSLIILSAVFSAFDSAIPTDNNQKERLELLCRLADSDKSYIADIHEWACSMMKDNTGLFPAYPSQFSYLCLAVGTEIPADCPKVLFDSPRHMYETARSAFRNGQWKSVAVPNLQKIDLITLPRCERDWLAALRELADAQLTELSLEALEEQQNRLTSALSIMRTSSSSETMEKTLTFPISMLSAMLSTSHAFFQIVSIMLPFSTFLSGALQPNSFYNPVTAKRFKFALVACESTVNEALTEWSNLCRASFCADPTSFDLITLYYLRVSILLVIVRVLIKKQSSDSVIQIPPLNNVRTCSLFQRERLQWVIDKIPLLRYEAAPTIHTVKTLWIIIEQLSLIPYMLPRFFFQQFYHVDFKITTTPQAEKDKKVTVMSGETIPIRVDGAIISTHPSQVRSVIIYVEVTDIANHADNQELSEVVDPSENNYFTAQFLLTFRGSSDVKFRIEFIDQTSRKQWKAGGGTTLQFAVRDTVQPPVSEVKRPLLPGVVNFSRSTLFGSDM